MWPRTGCKRARGPGSSCGPCSERQRDVRLSRRHHDTSAAAPHRRQPSQGRSRPLNRKPGKWREVFRNLQRNCPGQQGCRSRPGCHRHERTVLPVGIASGAAPLRKATRDDPGLSRASMRHVTESTTVLPDQRYSKHVPPADEASAGTNAHDTQAQRLARAPAERRGPGSVSQSTQRLRGN